MDSFFVKNKQKYGSGLVLIVDYVGMVIHHFFTFSLFHFLRLKGAKNG
jgi:hypothetical protein